MFSAAWTASLVRLVLLLLAAVVLGVWYGNLFLWLFLATLLALGWHLFNLYRTERWLRFREEAQVADSLGIWGEVQAHIVRLQRRNRERKKSVRRLLKEFRKSTGAMPDGAIVLNPQNEIVWLNKAASRMLGLRRKVDQGQRIDNLVRHPDFIRHLNSGTAKKPFYITSQLDGSIKLSFQLVPYGQGQQLLLVKDVTREANLERMRRDFVANASHELRSPLTVINGYLDNLVEEDELQATWGEPLNEMHRQAERMNSIISDLLELSRLESGSSAANGDIVDVGGILSLLKKEASAVQDAPEVLLSLESQSKLRGSESELHSAFSNLVSNALKFTQSHGQVSIRWHVDAGGGHMSVSDTGVGIAEEDIPRLTERFYRVDPGRARQTGGTGLGLAIVKHALQRHQATLEIQSELGAGSTFICHFPTHRLKPAERAVPGKSERLAAK